MKFVLFYRHPFCLLFFKNSPGCFSLCYSMFFCIVKCLIYASSNYITQAVHNTFRSRLTFCILNRCEVTNRSLVCNEVRNNVNTHLMKNFVCFFCSRDICAFYNQRCFVAFHQNFLSQTKYLYCLAFGLLVLYLILSDQWSYNFSYSCHIMIKNMYRKGFLWFICKKHDKIYT